MKMQSALLVGLLGFSMVSPAFSADAPDAQSAESQSGRKVVNRVVPVYPTIARTMQLSGTVKLQALVLSNGTVKKVEVKGGNPLLGQAAQNAVREWKWAKAEHDSTETVEFQFKP